MDVNAAVEERTEDMSLSKSILLRVLSALLISWKRSSVCMSSWKVKISISFELLRLKQVLERGISTFYNV